MPTLIDTPTIDSQARALCQFIVDRPEFGAARGQIEAFLQSQEAQTVYREWQEKQHELHRMSHEGLQPNDQDLQEIDRLRQGVLDNELASDFIEAEGQMNGIFSSITKLLQQTLQLGRVPTEAEMAEQQSGCCGGGGGGGCGCH